MKMGFFDRFKKKKKAKDAGAQKTSEAAAVPAAPVEEPLPTEPVPRAFAVARKKNKEYVAAGKYNEQRAAVFEAQIAAIEASDASDDAKMTDLAQTMGGMLRVAQILANASA